jgi:hypothetical protein
MTPTRNHGAGDLVDVRVERGIKETQGHGDRCLVAGFEHELRKQEWAFAAVRVVARSSKAWILIHGVGVTIRTPMWTY